MQLTIIKQNIGVIKQERRRVQWFFNFICLLQAGPTLASQLNHFLNFLISLNIQVIQQKGW